VRGVEEGEATIERRAGRSGRWRTVATGPVGGRTVLFRRVRGVKRARYRMTVRAGDRTLRSFVVTAR
jgi:hypothetical protein